MLVQIVCHIHYPRHIHIKLTNFFALKNDLTRKTLLKSCGETIAYFEDIERQYYFNENA